MQNSFEARLTEYCYILLQQQFSMKTDDFPSVFVAEIGQFGCGARAGKAEGFGNPPKLLRPFELRQAV